MNAALFFVLVVALQRLAELVLAQRNTVALRRRGALEYGAAHYPLLVLLHAAWLLALGVQAVRQPVLDGHFAIPFVLLQPLRLWVLATLGERWTTRVLVLPGEPLARSGPYRWLDHPNYLVVALEIPLLARAVGSPWLALIFGMLNIALLAWRLRIEQAALHQTH